MKIDADRRNGRKSEPIHASTTERGYGWAHQRVRARLEPFVRSGRAVCVRCDLPIEPGEPWDLGHNDFDRWSRRWFDNPRVGQTVPLGDGLIEIHLGGGHWETIPAGSEHD